MKLLQITKRNRQLESFGRKEWSKFDSSIGYNWNDKKFTFIAQDENEIIGMIHFKINGGAAYIAQLLIKDNKRSKGIGSRLIRKFEAFAKKNKCHVAYLETSERHKEALKFYKKHGYKIIATLKDNKFHINWHFMEKKLK